MKYTIFALLGVFVLTQSCVSAGRYKEEKAALEKELAAEKMAKAESDKVAAEYLKRTSEVKKLADDNENSKKELEQKLAATSQDQGQLKANLEEMKKAMAEMKARQVEEQKRLKEFTDLTNRFKKLTDAGKLSVKVVDGKMVVNLGSDLLFNPGSAKLSAAGIQAIKDVTAQLSTIPDRHFQVEGHTDSEPIFTDIFPSNWELAAARALAVAKTMMENGMPADRISAASYADTHPVMPNKTVPGRKANRRVTIVVVPDLSSLPGYDELEKYSK